MSEDNSEDTRVVLEVLFHKLSLNRGEAGFASHGGRYVAAGLRTLGEIVAI